MWMIFGRRTDFAKHFIYFQHFANEFEEYPGIWEICPAYVQEYELGIYLLATSKTQYGSR